MYSSGRRLYVRAMSNVVRITTEVASLGREEQSMSRQCEKFFGCTFWWLSAPIYEVSLAEGQAREAASYFHRTLLNNIGD